MCAYNQKKTMPPKLPTKGFKPPTVRKPAVPRTTPRVQPGGPSRSVPSKPTPKKPVVQPKAAATGGSWLPTLGFGAASLGVGLLPSVIGGVTQVGTAAVAADAFKEVTEYLVDNPWSLAIIGGVVLLIVLR